MLQDWLDEGRLEEVESLIPLVREADRAQCEELLDAYRVLFVGLEATAPQAATELVSAASGGSEQAAADNSRTSPAASKMLLALAACLALVAVVPGWMALNSGFEQTVATKTTPAIDPQASPISLPSLVESASPFSRRIEGGLTLFATASIEPLARGVANQTDTAFRSLNEVSRNLNPIDQPLAAYRDAAPLIETLTHGLLPGTRSLSSAFSVLQESAADPVPHANNTPQEPSANTTPEGSAVI